MANQFVIAIVSDGPNRVAFRPDLPGAQVGDPLHAKPSDLVVWSNRTDLDLRIESIPPGQPLDQDLAAGDTSFSQFLVPGDQPTIEYQCTKPQKGHTIIVDGVTTT